MNDIIGLFFVIFSCKAGMEIYLFYDTDNLHVFLLIMIFTDLILFVHLLVVKYKLQGISAHILRELEGGDTVELQEFPPSDDVPSHEININESLCCICAFNKRNIVFKPCSHSVTCISCSNRILKSNNKCPLCRNHIKERIFYYTP